MNFNKLQFASSVIVLSVTSVACQQHDSSAATPADKVAATSAPAPQSPAVTTPLNLELSTNFSEHRPAPFADATGYNVSSLDRFEARASEARIRVNGKLHARFNQENYLQSVEGGEVSLEVKFR